MATTHWSVRSTSDVGRAIAEIRRSKDLTQVELATQAGMSRDTLAQLETGRSGRTLDQLLRLLRRMGATVTITLGNDDGQA